MSITTIPHRLMERLLVEKPINPVGIREWPRGVYTNCLGFAIGHQESFGFWEAITMRLDSSLEIGDAFVSKLKSLGYTIPRRIRETEEANDDEFVIAVFGFANYQFYKQFQGIVTIEGDFHLVRRELDGSWVHKPSWNRFPRVVTEEDGAEIKNKFDVSKVALFAFKAPSK